MPMTMAKTVPLNVTVAETYRARYKVGEAAEVLWDAIDEGKGNLQMPECRTQEPLDPRKWNKDVHGSWRRDLGDFNYGI